MEMFLIDYVPTPKPKTTQKPKTAEKSSDEKPADTELWRNFPRSNCERSGCGGTCGNCLLHAGLVKRFREGVMQDKMFGWKVVDAPLDGHKPGSAKIEWSHTQPARGPNMPNQTILKAILDKCTASNEYSIGKQSLQTVGWLKIHRRLQATATVDKNHETQLAQLRQEQPRLTLENIDEAQKHRDQEAKLVASHIETRDAQIEATLEVGKFGVLFVVDCDDEIHRFYYGLLMLGLMCRQIRFGRRCGNANLVAS
jgi:hypothetical protein